jgi:hypothetical protein
VHTIRHLEDILAQVTGGVDSLQSAITSIRSELSEPFLLIQARTTQLERVQVPLVVNVCVRVVCD